jgi:F0F1-type ATP synthase epsilon subunit
VAEPLRVMVWTPSETLVDVERVKWVHVELIDGKGLTVWPGHLAILGETTPGALRYADNEGIHEIELPPGVVQVQDSTVTVYLAGTIDELAQEGEEPLLRFVRLSEALISALAPGQRAQAQASDAT